MTATLLKEPRSASIALVIPEPRRNRSNSELTYYVHGYHGSSGGYERESLQDAADDLLAIGTKSGELRAIEMLCDADGEPLRSWTCCWDAKFCEWSQWK